MQRAMFDWNRGIEASPASGSEAPAPGTLRFERPPRPIGVVDETLRDGLQSASGVNPPLSLKIDLLHAMARVGVDVVNVGLPAAGPRHADDARRLCAEIADERLPVAPSAAARTVVADVEEVARLAERAGRPVEVYAFIGSSPIRHFVEGWEIAFLLRCVDDATGAARRAGLPFCLVAEDATRSPPGVLGALFRAAVDGGASRICLCDTTGHATPDGVAALVAFARRELAALGAAELGLDWHAHDDRGLGLSTALWAAVSGVDRVHGTALGVGERVGNTSLELLVDNLGRLGARPAASRERLAEYCALASHALGRPVEGFAWRHEMIPVLARRAAARPVGVAP